MDLISVSVREKNVVIILFGEWEVTVGFGAPFPLALQRARVMPRFQCGLCFFLAPLVHCGWPNRVRGFMKLQRNLLVGSPI